MKEQRIKQWLKMELRIVHIVCKTNQEAYQKLDQKETVALSRNPNQMSVLENWYLMNRTNQWDQIDRKIWWEEGIDVLRIDHWVRLIFYNIDCFEVNKEEKKEKLLDNQGIDFNYTLNNQMNMIQNSNTLTNLDIEGLENKHKI